MALPLLTALSVLVARAHAGAVCHTRYTDMGNVVRDDETGILWMKYTPTPEVWETAHGDCTKRGARLPSVLAMQTVVDESTGGLVPDIGGKPASAYWTVTTSSQGHKYLVAANGAVSQDLTKPKTAAGHKHAYRCVK